jgi:zinc protease
MEGKLSRFVLPNGLKVLIKEDHARKVAAIQLWVLVGSADEEPSELGISHLMEHMAFKGTQRRGVGQIATEVEGLGGNVNAYTSWDQTVFHLSVPSIAALQGLDILTDAVFNPVIDPGELAKEKQVVIEEILEGEERPERKASKQLFLTAYTRGPYRLPIIGYRETVEKFTRENIIAFRKKWYVPENMFLLIVGDVDPVKLKPEIERLTAGLKPTGLFRPPRPVEPDQREIRSSLTRDDNAKETRMHLAFHIPSLMGDDVNAIDLAADILGSRESSRLVRVLKKEKRLVHSISAHAITPKEPGLFVVSATLDGQNLEAATRAIMEEINRLGQMLPAPDELQRAKTNIEAEHLYARETASGTARSMGTFEAELGDAQYEAKYLTLNAAVTPEQVSKVVKKYFAPPNSTVTVLIPRDQAPDFRIEKLTQVLQSFEPKKASIAQATPVGEVLTRTLPNGIRVVLARDGANPVVSFRIACLGGKRYETKQNEDIMNFIAQMLDKGAGRMDEVEISRKIEDMGGRLKGFSGYDSFGLSVSIFSRYLDDGLNLMAQLYTNPTFPQDKMERERALIINRIRTEPDRPVQYAVNVMNETLFTHHPYGFDQDGTIATVSGFTPDDLKDTYKRYSVPANTVITAVGDMDVERAMETIAEIFGKIPATPLDPPKIPAEEPLTTVREKTVRIPRAKAHLMMGFRGTTLADEERYALDVLNDILAGMGGRLFLELRDKESLAYSVTSFVRPGMDPGLFALYLACDVPKLDQALRGMQREIERIREHRVSDEELKRSIIHIIGSHQIALQSSWARAENMGLNTLYSLGYDYEAEYVKKISQVTADQVLAAARKFLDMGRCVVVQILPEDKEEAKP